MNQYNPVTPPGVKNDRGRIVLILIVGAIAFGIFSAWPHIQNFWDDFMVEISGEFGFPYESRYDQEDQESIVEEPITEEPEITTESNFEVTTENNFQMPTYSVTNSTVNSNVSDEMTQQILRESRQQIIDEMTRNGQQDQIPLVLQMLDQMEAQY
ncbi:MAG: hypothetical protein R3B71_02745 [Candidatus Gracilibacteria bacterium]